MHLQPQEQRLLGLNAVFLSADSGKRILKEVVSGEKLTPFRFRPQLSRLFSKQRKKLCVFSRLFQPRTRSIIH